MMRFDLPPEQQALKDTARGFAAEEIIPVAMRDAKLLPDLRGDEAGTTHRHCTEPTQGMS